MEKKKILSILFWILLIILIVLIIWRIFGNSPSDFSILITALLTILMKMWAISDELNNFKHEVKFSFHKVKENIDNINNKVNKMESNSVILSKNMPKRKSKNPLRFTPH